MTDRYDQDLLLGYLEGDLDPARRSQVDQMLAEDPQLASLMSALAGDRAALRGMPAEQVPGDLGFDLVQGLERRMLLDAPEVPMGGPIPIQRGHELAPPANGVRWGRVIGLTGMAAALAMAAGLVVYFDAFNPLSQTARDLVQQPAPTSEADLQHGGVASNEGNAIKTLDGQDGADEALEMAAPGGIADGLAAGPADGGVSEALLAERAHDAVRNRGTGEDAAPGGASLQPNVERLADGTVSHLEARIAAAGQQVALTAYAPEQALHIQSDDPDESRAQLLAWCVDNGVPIVEPQLAGTPATGADAPPQQIALLIEKDELDKLLLAMNRDQSALRNNQRAELDEPDNTAYLQPARPQALSQDTQDDEGAEADVLQETPATPALVELRVPEDLGDAVQTQLNVANTLVYSNRSELARAAQREAEVLRNQRSADPAVADADEAGPVAPDIAAFEEAIESEESDTGAFTDDAGPGRQGGRDAGPTRGGGARARDGSRGAAPAVTQNDAEPDGNHADPHDGPGDGAADTPTAPGAAPPSMREPAARPETDTDAAERGRADEDAPGVDPAEKTEDPQRGNWLLIQVPLAPSTPIWTDPPTAQLVPILFARRVLDTEEAPPGEDTATDAVEIDPVESPAEVTPPPAEDD